MAEAGISTLGVKFGYAAETTAGTKPNEFKWLRRCNGINGISLETEQIDASALEDEISRYVAGRQDTGGTWSVTFNLTNEVIEALESMISAYKSLSGNRKMWFEVWSPSLEEAFFVIAQPPLHIPLPEISQNSLQTVEMTFTIEEYKGMDDAIEPTDDVSGGVTGYSSDNNAVAADSFLESYLGQRGTSTAARLYTTLDE